jgi:hypothetical protein
MILTHLLENNSKLSLILLNNLAIIPYFNFERFVPRSYSALLIAREQLSNCLSVRGQWMLNESKVIDTLLPDPALVRAFRSARLVMRCLILSSTLATPGMFLEMYVSNLYLSCPQDIYAFIHRSKTLLPILSELFQLICAFICYRLLVLET